MDRRKFLQNSVVGVGSMALLGNRPAWADGEGDSERGPASGETMNFDIAPFARRIGAEDRHVAPVTLDFPAAGRAGKRAEKASDGRYVYGLQWTEERDIKEVRVRFKPGSVTEKATVEYWCHNWPCSPPAMPEVEDPADDPWQGEWLNAETKVSCEGSECRYTFQPLAEAENPQAENLPGVDYRRTLKARLLFTTDPTLEGVQVFAGSVLELVKIRIELGAGEGERYEWKGGLSVYNGELKAVKLWKGTGGDTTDGKHFQVVTEGSPKGLLVELAAAKPSLPGSEDITIVTLEAGDRTFSFAVSDLEKGPIYVPVFHGYVSLASDDRTFSPSIVKPGAKIRERIPQEPEQSYERASREIPPLNPAEARTLGERVFFPLAVEASWQKFAVEWGGNVFASKDGIRAQGVEGGLQRLEWDGDRITWCIGTGARPDYRPGWKDSTMSVLDDYIPVTTARWLTDGISYSEESFATLLSGPLSPGDPRRSEWTPAVLMMKVQMQNPGTEPAEAHLWLATDPDEEVTYENGELLGQAGELVRARVKPPDSAQAQVSAAVPYGSRTLEGIHVQLQLAAGEKRSVFISIPFIPRLSGAERARLAELDYDAEHSRVVNYWREIVARTVAFDVPDEKVAKLAKALVPHILVAVIKQPQSGLYFVPAGTLYWGLASNEGVGECLMLDALGHSHRAAEYLETWIRLQSLQSIPGTFGNQRGTYNVGTTAVPVPTGMYRDNCYNLNPGCVLGGLAEHYFFTRDQQWLRRVTPSMLLAADWMVEQRKRTKVLDEGERVPEYGLLPAGRLEDPEDWGHWVGVNAEAVAGMTRLAEALADIGAPEAAHYADEAAVYKQDLRDSVTRAYRQAAVIQLRDNTYVPFVPTRIHQRMREFGPMRVGYYSRYPTAVSPVYRLAATREVYAGPIYLLLRNIFGVDEPLANWILDDWEDNSTMSSTLGVNVHGWVDEKDWFSRGGMSYQPTRSPVPIYLRRNEVAAAIRSVYNSFVSTHYPDLNCIAECYYEWGHTIAMLIKTFDEGRLLKWVRAMLVREDGDAVWLASGIPREWLAPGKKIEIKDAPTYFGPMSYRIDATSSGVEARVKLPTRNKIGNAWLAVRAPEGKRIRSVEVDGKLWSDFDAARERIHLPVEDRPMQISVRF